MKNSGNKNENLISKLDSDTSTRYSLILFSVIKKSKSVSILLESF